MASDSEKDVAIALSNLYHGSDSLHVVFDPGSGFSLAISTKRTDQYEKGDGQSTKERDLRDDLEKRREFDLRQELHRRQEKYGTYRGYGQATNEHHRDGNFAGPSSSSWHRKSGTFVCKHRQ
jgi:hypothetical protein